MRKPDSYYDAEPPKDTASEADATIRAALSRIPYQYDANIAKDIVSQAVLEAIVIVTEVMKSPASSQSERLSAAKIVVELGLGKNNQELQVVTKQQDLASQLFEAIQRGRDI